MFDILGVWVERCSVVVGFVYPAYRSFKALEAKEPEGSATWLTYWLVFSLFSVVEVVTDTIISRYAARFLLPDVTQGS